MKTTYTLATMAVSQASFMEVHAKLLGAGYDHAIYKKDDGTDLLDMTGIGLVPNADAGIAHAEHMASDSDQPVPLALMGTVAGRDWLLQEAVRVIQAAQDLGFVLTIDLAPRRPLAMGNYEMLATVRPDRGPRGDYEPPLPPGFDPDTYNWRNAAADSTPVAPASSYLTKHAMQPYALPKPASVYYSLAAVRSILADAHAHYDAQVRLLGGLARPDDLPREGCAECGKTSTRDSMWALYCVACIESKIAPALAAPAQPAGDAAMPVVAAAGVPVAEFAEVPVTVALSFRPTEPTQLVSLVDAQAALAAERDHVSWLRQTLLLMKQETKDALQAKDARFAALEADLAHSREAAGAAARDKAAMLVEHMRKLQELLNLVHAGALRFADGSNDLDPQRQEAYEAVKSSAKRMLGIE